MSGFLLECMWGESMYAHMLICTYVYTPNVYTIYTRTHCLE